MPTDRKIIYEVLGRFQEYFGKSLKPEIQALYIEHLEKIDEDKFKIASVKLLREFEPTSTKPFPLIKDFMEMIGLDGRTEAINIVSLVRNTIEKIGQYHSINFNNRALHSVIERYGGWVDMVNNNTDEWWSLHERNFITAYEAAKRSGLEGPEYLMGLLEIDNRMKGITPEKLLEEGKKLEMYGYLSDEKYKKLGE